MIKIETHCHSLGSSGCATTAPEKIARVYSEYGYGGIVLTNHYAAAHFNNYPGESKKEKLDYYFSLGDKMRRCCEEYGLKFFIGAEVCVQVEHGYAEYILYGFDKKYLYDNPPLFTLTQRELFRLADKNDVFMYQAHPFRDGIELGDPAYMHGAEAFNGHYHHEERNELATEFCRKNGLTEMSGTDYHHFGQPVTGGLIVDENINDEVSLVSYIRSGKAEMIKDDFNYRSARAEYLEGKRK